MEKHEIVGVFVVVLIFVLFLGGLIEITLSMNNAAAAEDCATAQAVAPDLSPTLVHSVWPNGDQCLVILTYHDYVLIWDWSTFQKGLSQGEKYQGGK